MPDIKYVIQWNFCGSYQVTDVETYCKFLAKFYDFCFFYNIQFSLCSCYNQPVEVGNALTYRFGRFDILPQPRAPAILIEDNPAMIKDPDDLD